MTTTTYLWDTLSDNLLSEDDGLGTTTYTNEPTEFGDLVSQNKDINTNFYHFNARGDTRELTDDDEVVTDTRLYDAWGNVINSSGSTIMPFQFVGQLGYGFDTKLHRSYVRARWYNADLARWSSVDPLGFADGINLFRYVANSPVSSSDATGFSPQFNELPNDPLNLTGCRRCKIYIRCWTVGIGPVSFGERHCGLALTTPNGTVMIDGGYNGSFLIGLAFPTIFVTRPPQVENTDTRYYELPNASVAGKCDCLLAAAESLQRGLSTSGLKYQVNNCNSNWMLGCLLSKCEVGVSWKNKPYAMDSCEQCVRWGQVGRGGSICLQYGSAQCPF